MPQDAQGEVNQHDRLRWRVEPCRQIARRQTRAEPAPEHCRIV